MIYSARAAFSFALLDFWRLELRKATGLSVDDWSFCDCRTGGKLAALICLREELREAFERCVCESLVRWLRVGYDWRNSCV